MGKYQDETIDYDYYEAVDEADNDEYYAISDIEMAVDALKKDYKPLPEEMLKKGMVGELADVVPYKIKHIISEDEDVEARGSVKINWMYPDIYKIGKENVITIALFHTRAANDIKIKFISGRDGWQITMDKTSEGEGGFDEVIEKDVEVAFIPAFNE